MRFAQYVTIAGAALILVLFAEAQPVEGKEVCCYRDSTFWLKLFLNDRAPLNSTSADCLVLFAVFFLYAPATGLLIG